MDERHEIVCKLLKEIGFEHDIVDTLPVMKYGSDTDPNGAIIFNVETDIKKISRLFSRIPVYYMRFYFGKSAWFLDNPCKSRVLQTAIDNVGCKQCWTCSDVNDAFKLYLCVPIECHKYIIPIIEEFNYIWGLENPSEEEKARREAVEMKEQLRRRCK